MRHWKDKTDIPAKQVVRWIGIQTGKFYDWKLRYGKVNEHNGWIPRDHWLTVEERQAIVKFHYDYPLEGYRRLTYMMLDADVVAASPASVYRVLKQANLIGRRTSKTTSKGKGFHQPSGPHRHWHVDVSYLNLAGTFYYLCSVLDGYSRSIVHWEIRESMKEPDVETILQRAKEKHPKERPRIITDNGPQFIAKDFKQFIRISGMTHVRTSPYYPQSNGKLERYHRTIKSDCIRPGTPLCLDDARRLVDNFVQHYNGVRLHSAIGYVTPNDKMLGREQDIFDARDLKLAEARQLRQQRRAHWRAEVECTRADAACSWRQAVCYTIDTWAEDRATVGTDPSAVPATEAKRSEATPASPRASFPTLLWEQCDKPNQPSHQFDGICEPITQAGLNSRTDKSGSR